MRRLRRGRGWRRMGLGEAGELRAGQRHERTPARRRPQERKRRPTLHAMHLHICCTINSKSGCRGRQDGCLLGSGRGGLCGERVEKRGCLGCGSGQGAIRLPPGEGAPRAPFSPGPNFLLACHKQGGPQPACSFFLSFLLTHSHSAPARRRPRPACLVAPVHSPYCRRP